MRFMIQWLPRYVGLAFALFASVFALDVFEAHRGLDLFLALVAHLIPAALVLAATLVGWRRPVAGGVAFLLLGGAYILMVGPDRPASWHLAIALPAFAISLLFFTNRFIAAKQTRSRRADPRRS